VTGRRSSLTNDSAWDMKLPMTAWVELLNMATTSMCHFKGDVRESLRMIESFRVRKVDELFEVIHVEILPVEPGPVYAEPFVQLLKVDEVFSAESDGIVDLLSLDQVRIVNEIAMKGAEPQLSTADSIFMEFNDVVTTLLEIAAQHGLEVIRIVHQDFAGDPQPRGLNQWVGAMTICSTEVVFVHRDSQITSGIDLVEACVLCKVKK
jgi:hypothetical protein